MSKTLKRILAMALVICALLSYTVPAANAADLTGIGYADAFKTKVTYNFNQLTNYPSTPDGKGYLSDLLKGYELSDGTKTTPLNQRYEDQKWAYEAASTGLCGSTGENEHLTSTRVRMISNSTYKGLRISMGKDQGDWIAFRIKSPGAGTFTMKLDFYSEANAPTVAFYILEAEGDVVADLQTTEAHDTVLARQERIQTEMDPDNRIGKVNQSASPNGETNTAYIGSYTFEANKDYILVAETYKTAAVPDWYAYFYSVTFTKDGTEGE